MINKDKKGGGKMEIDVSIERIDNGYVITSNDSSDSKVYYKRLEEFAAARILEDLRELDKQIREHSKPDKSFYFKLKSDL